MKRLLIISIVLIINGFYFNCAKVKHYELSQFISPETCGSCHEDIYNQWKGSTHSQSHGDPLYLAVALHDLKGLTDKDEITEAELCVKCHTPVGYVSGMPVKTSDHKKKISELARKGVQCDFCHSAVGAKKIYNAMLELDPGHGEDNPGTKRGPFKDSSSDFHLSAYSEFHTRSEVCGVCHDVRHVVFGTVLESPYNEWREGPYNADPDKRISCQGCHMFQRPGIPATGSTDRPNNPGNAATGAKRRGHIFTHYFVGGNTLIPSLINNPLQVKMAEARLKNAATVSIDGKLSDNMLKVSVYNSGAGHSIPTGLTHVRQIWLEVTVSSLDGRIIFRSGSLDTNGYFDASTIKFMTVFGDEKRNPVMNVAKARTVLSDHRIKPLEKAIETYKLPVMKDRTLVVEAKLWYRVAPQELVDSVLGKGSMKIPVVLMAFDKKIITF